MPAPPPAPPVAGPFPAKVPPRDRPMPSLPLTRRHRFAPPAWALLLAGAGIALFVGLGRWQWHRAGEKRALAAAFAAGQAAPATALAGRGLAGLPRYARLQLEGRYDARHQFLLDNVLRDGHPGYEVLTPLRLADGRWLLVNRGWIALPTKGRDALPRITLDDSEPRALSGRVDDLPAPALAAGRTLPEPFPGTAEEAPDRAAGWPRRTSYPASADLAAALGHALEPRQLLLDEAVPGGYRRDWKPASAGFGPERHIAYALQWWGFAALALVLLVIMNLEKTGAADAGPASRSG